MTRLKNQLREVFGSPEAKVQKLIRSSTDFRAELLYAAGLPLADKFETLRLKFGGEPDMVYRDADGRLVVIEVCFLLEPRHIHKDLMYLIDPELDGRVAALLWLCDSHHKLSESMVRHYSNRLGVDQSVRLVALVPSIIDALSLDRCRFTVAFDIAPPSRITTDGKSNLRHELESAAADDELNASTIGRLLAMSPAWVTTRARRVTKFGRPILTPKLSATEELRGADGRFRYSLADVIKFIDDLEAWVASREGLALPLVRAPDLDSVLVSATTVATWPRAPKNFATLKRRAGGAVAFHLSTAGQGYSLLFDRSRAEALQG